MLQIKVVDNPKSDKEGNRYLMVATLQEERKDDQEDDSDEEFQ